MTVFEWISVLGLVATVLLGTAALGSENRAWAKKQAIGALTAITYVAIIGTGVIGVIMFGTADGAPTRKDILLLVMQLFNFFMGIHLMTDSILERRRKSSREALEQIRAEAAGTLKSSQSVPTTSLPRR